jgi:hypothetical protein
MVSFNKACVQTTSHISGIVLNRLLLTFLSSINLSCSNFQEPVEIPITEISSQPIIAIEHIGLVSIYTLY